MAWGGWLKNGLWLFWTKNWTPGPSLFCEIGHPLTKICLQMAKMHVNRRKLLAHAARGKYTSHFYFTRDPTRPLKLLEQLHCHWVLGKIYPLPGLVPFGIDYKGANLCAPGIAKSQSQKYWYWDRLQGSESLRSHWPRIAKIVDLCALSDGAQRLLGPKKHGKFCKFVKEFWEF